MHMSKFLIVWADLLVRGRDSVSLSLRFLGNLHGSYLPFSSYEFENIEYLSVPLIACSNSDCKKHFLSLERPSYYRAACSASDGSGGTFFHSPVPAFLAPSLLDIYSVSPSS